MTEQRSKDKFPIPDVCPSCGSRTVVPIIYGLPGPEVFEAYQRGEVLIGGCMVRPDNPRWGCLACGQRDPGKDLRVH